MPGKMQKYNFIPLENSEAVNPAKLVELLTFDHFQSICNYNYDCYV
jgi:hypothetical protein